MRRRFSFPWDAQEVCLELETVLCQDSVRVFLTIDVSCLWQTKSNMFQSPTIRTRLMYLCTHYTDEELEHARWWTKYDQRKEKQTDICCCRQIDEHCETMME